MASTQHCSASCSRFFGTQARRSDTAEGGRFRSEGRRKTTIAAAAGFAVCTGLIAILPGYDAWGFLSIVPLIFLRLLDGMFLGGEYSAANPLAMEYAPRSRRGLYGSSINTGYPLALAVITILTILTRQIFSSGPSGSAYAVWGWRIPFIIGFVLSAGVFF